MPALSYAYQYQPGKFASVYRSSQSKVGFNSRSSDDELMLKMIGNPKYDPKSFYPFIQMTIVQLLTVKSTMPEASMLLWETKLLGKVINLSNTTQTANWSF